MAGGLIQNVLSPGMTAMPVDALDPAADPNAVKPAGSTNVGNNNPALASSAPPATNQNITPNTAIATNQAGVNGTAPLMSTGYTPVLNDLKSGDTVEGRVNRLVDAESPLVQDARTRAAQAANARGLLNSSMAVGEGEKAAYAAALPIAQQDATASLTVSRDNQLSQNQALQLGTTGAQAMEQQQLRGNQSTQLAQIEDANKVKLQTSQSASQFFAQMATSIGDILKEPNIGVEQKNQLVQKQLDLLKNGMTVIGGIGNLNLAGLLTFPTTGTPGVAGTPGTAGAAGTPAAGRDADGNVLPNALTGNYRTTNVGNPDADNGRI